MFTNFISTPPPIFASSGSSKWIMNYRFILSHYVFIPKGMEWNCSRVGYFLYFLKINVYKIFIFLCFFLGEIVWVHLSFWCEIFYTLLQFISSRSVKQFYAFLLSFISFKFKNIFFFGLFFWRIYMKLYFNWIDFFLLRNKFSFLGLFFSIWC